jgi:penicillin-binding protein 2
MTEGRAGLRLKVLAALVVAMFLALSTRLWFLQVLAAEQFRQQAADQAVRLVEVPALRGRILDASGQELVVSRRSLVLTINREEVADDKEDVLYRLSQLLDIPASELGARLDSDRYYSFSPIPVAIDVPEKVVDYVKEHPREFPGVDVEKLPVRDYPFGDEAAHVLGYLGQISEDKLASPAFAGYEPGDLVGVAGVESVYEHDLAGIPGIIKYQVNSAGQTLRTIGSQLPQPGNDVHLTIDIDTQGLAEESLRLGMSNARGILDAASGRYLAANAGAVIVMNPDDGSIEAMVSAPTFQPSIFTQSMSNAEFQHRFGQGRGSPLLNRAIAGQYPPGSTYKPWIALSALQRGRATPDQGYSCPGTWITPFNEDDPNAVQFPFDNWTTANLGFMDLARALAVSCDTIFYPIGYSYWDDYFVNSDERARGVVSKDPLQHDLGAIGFGALTNVDLPAETPGRVPTPAWKDKFHRDNPQAFPEGDWFPGDLINMSIGQGDTLVTPLQIATAYSALMDEGRECTPHVLDYVAQTDTETVVRRYRPRCHQVRAFDPGFFTYVREALIGTVRNDGGTAVSAFAGFPFSQIWVAGKTGTAEVKALPPKQDYSWFAAMTQGNGERHVVVVLVEQGGHGSTTAAPIARRIIEGMYGLDFSGVGLGGQTGLAGTD